MTATKPKPVTKPKPAASKPKPRPKAKKAPQTTGLPEGIVFFCKDCHKIVEVNRVGRRFVYTCKECGTKNVAFGTTESIHSFFHIKEEAPAEEETTKEGKEEKEELPAKEA